MLKPSNYSLWAIRMQIILEANGLWETIKPNEKTQEDNKKDKTAIVFLYQALPKDQLLQITKHKTAKAIWDALKTRHIGEERVQQARLQTLKSDFKMLHMKEDKTIDTFTTKLTTLVNKADSLWHTMEDETLVHKLLNVVPDRIKYKKGKQVDNQEKLMFTQHENKRKYFRGRGRGKHKFLQGRNHENFKEEKKEGETSHWSYNKNNFKKSSYDTSKLRCYKCKKLGHISPDCPLRIKTNEQSNLVEEDLEPTLLMTILEDKEERKVSLHKEDVGYKETNKDSLWYLDNRASNHMTGVREHFKELDEEVSGKEYKNSIKNELRTTLKMLRTYRGGEFTSSEFTQYCKENDIARQITAPYSPQQNGVVERRNRTIMSTTILLEDINPYEAIKRRKPNLENLRIFVCIAYAKVPSQHLTKLNDRSTKMVYIGNKQGSKAYHLFDPTTQSVCVSRDVKFKGDEAWDWKDYMNSPSNFDHTPVRGFRTLNDLYENTKELLLAEDEPRNYKEASSDKKWIEAMKVELDSINRNNTWKLTTLPKGHKAIGLKWVFKTKKDANGNIIKLKARLVAKGYIQQHGIDFEEVFAPVVRMETVRLLLAITANNKWEVHHLDVKYVFLHGALKEEVYVTQPEGFIKRQNNGKVYRLIKALYELRQAPRAWNIKLNNTLKSLNFKKCGLEQAIYTKTSKDSTILIGVYIDDLIIIGTPKEEIDLFKA
nr:ribonuclease H-like domain, reverse transcriptase, RNA-dependent DNA polymerase [Tanacetum cinerariifolium]